MNSNSKTLAQFLAENSILVCQTLPTGAKAIFHAYELPGVRHHDLWHLRDYVVSSVTSGPMVTLIPKHNPIKNNSES